MVAVYLLHSIAKEVPWMVEMAVQNEVATSTRVLNRKRLASCKRAGC